MNSTWSELSLYMHGHEDKRCFLCLRPYFKCFMHGDSFRPHTTLRDGYYYSPHFIDEETEAQRD